MFFCGINLPLEIAIVLNIKPNIKSIEHQQLFSHKEHFIHLVKNNAPLHPNFFDNIKP